MKNKGTRKFLAMLLVLVMLVTNVIPGAFQGNVYAATGSSLSRVTDNTTLDGWKQFFGTSDKVFNTQYSGHVWTDKSVTTDDGEFAYATELADQGDKIKLTDSSDDRNFLVSLSAMASSKSVTGQDNKPTDTMIVLDLSSSMYNGLSRTTATVKAMVDSVNSTIKQLQNLNVNNRVGVTIYFGGENRIQSTKDSHLLLLPLDRYTHTTDQYLTYSKDSKLETVGVNTNVKNASGKTITASRTVTDIAGTYTQQGILSALSQFLKADTKVPATAAVNAGETRVPVMVLMSDGEPTAATYEYTKLNVGAGMGNNTVSIRNPSETDFVTQLTASYAKEMIDAHYEEIPLFYTLSLGSSISYDVMDPADTMGKNFTPSSTIAKYWNNLVSKGSTSITVMNSPGKYSEPTEKKTYTVSKTTVTGKTLSGSKVFPISVGQRLYVDKAFEAATKDDLAKAFANIFQDITLQTHTYPTLVDGDENLDGYVSFVDKIGEYMNVKEIKGVLLGTTWYSGKELSKNFVSGGGLLGTSASPTALGDELVHSIQQRLGLSNVYTVRTLLESAYQNGQLSYNRTTGAYSNYVGWYSDASGNYLGFWKEGLTTTPDNAAFKNKSYLYLGETDESHGVKESDMMYTTVRVRENIETGEQSVSFAVPVALIPIVEYDVELDENDTLTSVTRGGADHPVRLVYEVALDDAINEVTLYDIVSSDYIDENENGDGSVNFYSNQFESDGDVGYGKVNTYSYFRPSHSNENYYYQNNETVYKDRNGTAYNSGTAPNPNGTFYRRIVVYSNNNGAIKAENYYRPLSRDAIQTAVSKADGTWYIPKGNVHVNMDGYTIEKASNETKTLENANKPYVDVNGHSVNDIDHSFVIGDTLGNNGKISLKPATAIRISKEVRDAESGNVYETNESFEFVITTSGEVNGNYDTILYRANGKQSRGTVVFSNGTAKVELKGGESIYITGLQEGKTLTVTETEEVDFILSEIEVDGNVITETTVSLTTSAGEIRKALFTNVPRGTGALTIAKVVEHPFGTDYKIPDDKIFTVKVTLESVAVQVGKAFTVKHSGDENITSVTLDGSKSFDLTLKDGDQVEIFGIPEGTKATVVETNPGEGFKDSYIVNAESVNGDAGVIESIAKAPMIDYVTVVNTYEPDEVEVKINLSGTKKVLGTASNADEPNTETFALSKKTTASGSNTTASGSNTTASGSNTLVSDSNVTALSGNENSLLGKVKAVFGKIQSLFGLSKTIDSGIVSVADQEIPCDEWDDAWEFEFVIQKYDIVTGQWETLEGSSVKINKDNNKIEFEKELTFDKVGTYGYQVIEKNHGLTIAGITYDATMHTFDIIVTDKDMDGKLEAKVRSSHGEDLNNWSETVDGAWTNDQINFVNRNNRGETSLLIMIKKYLENESGSPNVSLEGYQFELYTSSNADYTTEEPMRTEKTDASGETYVQLKYNYNQTGTYSYRLQEKPTGITGMVDSNKVYDFTVEVTAENDGSVKAEIKDNPFGTFPGTFGTEYDLATFSNAYNPTPAKVNLNVKKELENRTLKEGEFEFQLDQVIRSTTGELNTRLVATASNAADGNVDFGELPFDRVGTYEYTVRETSESGKGVIVDDTVYDVVITVKDVDGELNAELEVLTVPGDEMVFVNKYIPAATEVELSGQKVLLGKTLDGGQFTFVLAESDDKGNIKSDGYQQLVTNQADGTFTFDELSFAKKGTYYYVVSETIPEDKHGIEYDTTKYLVKIDVTYNKDTGKFIANETLRKLGSGDVAQEIHFENRYTAADATTEINGYKILKGRALEAAQFEFNLYASDASWSKANIPMMTTKNAANGTFTFRFGEDYFDTAGTYYYIMTETQGAEPGYTYDDKVVGVIVNVTDDLSGQLHAKVSYVDLVKGTGVSEQTPAFINEYEEPDKPYTPSDDPDKPGGSDKPKEPATPTEPVTPGDGTTPESKGDSDVLSDENLFVKVLPMTGERAIAGLSLAFAMLALFGLGIQSYGKRKKEKEY